MNVFQRALYPFPMRFCLLTDFYWSAECWRASADCDRLVLVLFPDCASPRACSFYMTCGEAQTADWLLDGCGQTGLAAVGNFSQPGQFHVTWVFTLVVWKPCTAVAWHSQIDSVRICQLGLEFEGIRVSTCTESICKVKYLLTLKASVQLFIGEDPAGSKFYVSQWK